MKYLISAVLTVFLIFITACEIGGEDPEPFTPVLTAETGSSWDDFSVADPFVYKDSGTYYMYYAGNTTSYSAPYEIGYATSTDGITWDKPSIAALGNTNRVLTHGTTGTWNEKGVSGPSVVKISDTEYHMWFSGLNASDEWQIGYASSTDGITWVEGSNPVLTAGANTDDFDRVHVFDPHVYYEGGTYHIWYAGVSNSNLLGIGYTSTATPSAALTNASSPVLSSAADSYFAGGLRAPSVLYDSSTWWMWPTSSTGSSYGYAVAVSQSSSPDSGWSMHSSPVITRHETGFDDIETGLCSVLKNASVFEMWYTGWSTSGTSSIGFATSSNGITWIKYKE